MAGDVSYLHPELLVEQVAPELGLDHDALAAAGDADRDVDRGGQGGQLEEVIQQPPQSMLRDKLLVPEINIPAEKHEGCDVKYTAMTMTSPHDDHPVPDTLEHLGSEPSSLADVLHGADEAGLDHAHQVPQLLAPPSPVHGVESVLEQGELQ